MRKKGLVTILGIAAAAFLLVGCGKSSSSNGSSSSSNGQTTLTVGATAVPQAQILRHVQPELKKEGVNLKVKVFQDYVLPNKALADKELDANYFQHIPFLDVWNKKNNGTLVSAGTVHLEPIGIFSKKVKHLKDLKQNATVLVSTNVSDYGRVLTLFKKAGLITLKKGTKITDATFDDIATNKKHIQFKHSYEPKLMPTFYKNGQGDAVVINANFAEQAGLNPTKDSIALESKDSPYANIVAVRKGDTTKPAIKKLMKAVRSKSTQKWILDHYKGAILPVVNVK